MTEKHYTSGNRFYLRLLQSEDVTPAYEAWFRDPTVTEFLDSRNVTMAESQEYIRLGQATRSYFMHGVFDAENDHHIGNLKIGPISWAHGLSDLVTVIGDRRYWGKGVAAAAIKVGSHLAFEKYGMRKLCAGVAAGNMGSLKAYTRAGWIIEAILIGQHLIGGDVRDRYVISCFNPVHFPAPPAGLELPPDPRGS